MRLHAQGDRQSADRAEVLLRPRLVSLPEQSFVPELCRTLLAYPLVLLAMGLLAVHTAVFDEVAGGAVLELDGVAPVLAAVGACSNPVILAARNDVHRGVGDVATRLQLWFPLGVSCYLLAFVLLQLAHTSAGRRRQQRNRCKALPLRSVRDEHTVEGKFFIAVQFENLGENISTT